MAINLTEKAAEEVKRIIDEQSQSEKPMAGEVALRMGVMGGGCSGFQYSLGFDDKVNPEADSVMEHHGVKVVVDKVSAVYLDGTTVDFYDGIDRRGFTFNNPNAQKTCGCGSSFQV